MAGRAVLMLGGIGGAVGFSLGATIHSSGVSPINKLAASFGLPLISAQAILGLCGISVICIASKLTPTHSAPENIAIQAYIFSGMAAVAGYIMGAFLADYVRHILT